MKKLPVVGLVCLTVFGISACSSPSPSDQNPGVLDSSSIPTVSATSLPSPTVSHSDEAVSESSAEPTEARAAPEDTMSAGRPEDHLEDIRLAIVDAMNGEYSALTHGALVETMAQYNVTLDRSVYTVLSKNESSSAVVVGLQPQADVEYHRDGHSYTWAGNVRFAMTYYADRNERATAVSELSVILADKLASGEPATHRLVWTMVVADDSSTATLSVDESSLDM